MESSVVSFFARASLVIRNAAVGMMIEAGLFSIFDDILRGGRGEGRGWRVRSMFRLIGKVFSLVIGDWVWGLGWLLACCGLRKERAREKNNFRRWGGN